MRLRRTATRTGRESRVPKRRRSAGGEDHEEPGDEAGVGRRRKEQAHVLQEVAQDQDEPHARAGYEGRPATLRAASAKRTLRRPSTPWRAIASRTATNVQPHTIVTPTGRSEYRIFT